MKLCLLLAALALSACEKTDDTVALRQEADAMLPYYQAALDALDVRFADLVKRGLKLDRPLPGSDNAGRLVAKASGELKQLHQVLGDLPKQLAANPDEAALRRITDDARDQLDEGMTLVGGELGTAETWVSHAENEMAETSPAPH